MLRMLAFHSAAMYSISAREIPAPLAKPQDGIPQAGGHYEPRRTRSATACAAMDSPAPIESTPSLVFPFTLTWEGSQPRADAMVAKMIDNF